MISCYIANREGEPLARRFYPITFPWQEADGLIILGTSEPNDRRNGIDDVKRNELMTVEIEYLNKQEDINSIYLFGWNDFKFLNSCKKNIQHLAIELYEGEYFKNMTEVYNLSNNRISANTTKQEQMYIANYDTTPLYEFNDLKSITLLEYKMPNRIRKFKLDLRRFKHLEKFSGELKFVEKLESATSLKSLELMNCEEKSLQHLKNLKELDSLKLVNCNTYSLDGIENLPKMQCLYLHDLPNLTDISALRQVKHSLKALKIKNCDNLQDFSVLGELENLEFLELNGKNKIPSLSFIKNLKHLKTLDFNVDVLDNDLTSCFDLEYVYCGKRKLTYNHKFKAFPKGKYVNGVPTGDYVKGNEDIEMWRRFE